MQRTVALISFFLLIASCITTFPEYAAAGDQDVVINEFMFDPPDSLGDDDDYEWIELYNYGGDAVALDGWILNGVDLDGDIGAHSFYIIARQNISDPDEDGEYFEVFYNSDNGYEIRCAIFDAEGSDLGLENSGGSIELRDDTGVLIDSLAYAPLPGPGHTLEKICPFYESSIENWETSEEASAHGTPDGQNSKLVLGSTFDIEIRTARDSTILDFNVGFTNKTGDTIELWAWTELTYLDLGWTFELDFHFLAVPPFGSKSFSGSRVLPEILPEGDYLLRLIDGEDPIHSFGPENEEFSLLSSE